MLAVISVDVLDTDVLSFDKGSENKFMDNFKLIAV